MRKTLAIMTVAGLVLGALAAPSAVAGKKKKAKSGPVVMGTDAAGDWGANSALGPDGAPVGDALGQDLVEATIEMANKETINFIIKVNSLPPTGGVPEVSRYSWGMSVDGEYAELDGKFTNYSRGTCDPTAGSCPPPRDPGMQPFAVRANCRVEAEGAGNVSVCEEVGIVQATFDPANGTITIPVPTELINAKNGSKITSGQSSFLSTAGGAVAAMPAAFLTSTAMPLDALAVTETFVVSAKGASKK